MKTSKKPTIYHKCLRPVPDPKLTTIGHKRIGPCCIDKFQKDKAA